jgi:hypothetical protein
MYHLTAAENLPGILATHRLCSAAALPAHATGTVRHPRPESVSVPTPWGTALIRDQRPLHPRHLELQPGFSFEDLIGLLNRHVFFWPGTDAKPSRYGRNHFARYASSAPVFLRFPTGCLFERYPDAIRFCRYNSGAPRTVRGRKSPRGPDLFLPPERFSGKPSDVVEVAIPTDVELPHETQRATTPGGPWVPFT